MRGVSSEVLGGVRQAAWLIAPALLSVVGHLCFSSLLLLKWEAFEEREGGLLVAANLSLIDTGAPGVGPPWPIVFSPSWIAEAAIIVSCVCALRLGVGGPSLNARIGHFNSLAQASLSAVFKLNLLWRLEDREGDWLVVFWPMYASFVVQMCLHSCKQPDERNRRPGFPFSATHLLSIVVSFKLAGIYSSDDVTWANALWPLWGLASFLGATLFAVCIYTCVCVCLSVCLYRCK